MSIESGDLIKYSSEPDYTDLIGDPEWEHGIVVGPWPGSSEMFVVWWFEAAERTREHVSCVKDDEFGSYRFVRRHDSSR